MNAGRISFRLLAVLALMAPPAGAAERAVDVELVLAADISGSIDIEEAGLQRQGFIAALLDGQVQAVIQSGRFGRIALTYAEWAGAPHQETLVPWTEVGDRDSAERFAAALAAAPVRTATYTSISRLIDYALPGFASNGFRGERHIIDISGDGPNNKGPQVTTSRDAALARGITINGLAIINGRPGRYGFPPLPDLDLYYADCVIGGPGAFVVVANGFEDFARAIRRKMLLEIAGVLPPRPRLHRTQARPRPPCDAGEKRLQDWEPASDF